MSYQNKLLAISSLLAISACGHYSPPETFEAKMSRYQVRQSGAGSVPHIESINFRAKGSRAPASVATNDENVGFSNKKLYFITLYNQYNELQAYSSATPREITQCPSFHSALVDHSMPFKAHVNWTPNYREKDLSDENSAKYYPELFLSMDAKSSQPRVLDLARKDYAGSKELVQKAIDLHVDKTHAELAELCEYGTSDNYYAFENLSTEMKRRHVATPGPQGMSVLLKTTVFSNKALIDSLSRNTRSSRAPASAARAMDYEFEVMKRLGVPWASQYYQALKVGP